MNKHKFLNLIHPVVDANSMIMKNQLYILLVLAVVTLLQGCRPEVPTDIAAPGSKLDGINADWVMVAVQIVDNNTLNGDSISITSYYVDDTPAEINFNSSSFEYTVTENGKRNFFGTSGTWAFDDEEFPTMIMLTTNTGDVLDLTLTTTIRPQDTRLRFNYERSCDNTTPYATYYFEYERK